MLGSSRLRTDGSKWSTCVCETKTKSGRGIRSTVYDLGAWGMPNMRKTGSVMMVNPLVSMIVIDQRTYVSFIFPYPRALP